MTDEIYDTLVGEMTPTSYATIAEDWMGNNKEWYHAVVAMEDLPIVIAIPNLRIYSWCRCKLVANDQSEAHFHWHGLVHFINGEKLDGWRRKAKKVGVHFSSNKNTFRKIKCLDHGVGVLRYLTCRDGQKVGNRDADGLVTHPHVHYSRKAIDAKHCHEKRGKICLEVRNEISTRISEYIDLTNLPNWTTTDLHDKLACDCDRSLKGEERKKLANERRKNFYQTPKGMAMKEKYRRKLTAKKELMNILLKTNVSLKAELCKDTLVSLCKQL